MMKLRLRDIRNLAKVRVIIQNLVSFRSPGLSTGFIACGNVTHTVKEHSGSSCSAYFGLELTQCPALWRRSKLDTVPACHILVEEPDKQFLE